MISSRRLFGSSFTRRFCDSKKTLGRIPSYINTSERNPSTVPTSNSAQRSAQTAEEAVNNLLYNFGTNIRERNERHILSVFVDNETGVLSKVSGLLSSRGFNIDSLAVSKTDVNSLSRMTIVLNGNHTQMEQAKRQLEDLCDVWAVFDYTSPESTILRELCLVKCSTTPPNSVKSSDYESLMATHFHKQAILGVAKEFEAKVCDIGSDTMVLELVTWPRRVDAFLKLLKPFKIIEAARSGMIAMNRAKVVDPLGDEHDEAASNKDSVIDLADLPPS